MRPERTLKTLEDIRDAAAFILESAGSGSGEDYFRNRLLRQAVERNFEIIGEAMGRLAHEDPETAKRIGDYERIIAFRNVLIHGYDLVKGYRTEQGARTAGGDRRVDRAEDRRSGIVDAGTALIGRSTAAI